ncbi:MAG: hypothetical protein ACJAS3_001744, partial [Roseivirga sp.]
NEHKKYNKSGVNKQFKLKKGSKHCVWGVDIER